MMPRSNLAAKGSVYVHVNVAQCTKNADKIGTGHLTTNRTLCERSQSRGLYYHLAEDIMPQCILTSSVWIPQQNVAQIPHLMPTVSDCNLHINSSPKLENDVSLGKMKWNKNKFPPKQQLGFSGWIFKHRAICNTDHTLILWLMRIRTWGVCLLSG